MPNHFKRIVSKVLSKRKPLHVSFSFYNLRLEFSPLHIYFFFFILASLMIKFTNLSDLWYLCYLAYKRNAKPNGITSLVLGIRVGLLGNDH